jgi:hypothetical protein
MKRRASQESDRFVSNMPVLRVGLVDVFYAIAQAGMAEGLLARRLELFRGPLMRKFPIGL